MVWRHALSGMGDVITTVVEQAEVFADNPNGGVAGTTARSDSGGDGFFIKIRDFVRDGQRIGIFEAEAVLRAKPLSPGCR